ncbi:Ff.00g108970.m01.CDS01 [Fusarium sp. VM40]|nr:Ff.00g108970.m01.CDS01 [Fusarium sp. VM40]
MRKSTPYQLAFLMASVATAAETSTCAIDCFQGFIANTPPAQCKEATNYLCFCTMPTLQDEFMQCVDKTCASEKGAATSWAGELCSKLGKPIDLGTPEAPPKTDATTAVSAPVTSTSDEVKPTTEAGTVSEPKKTTEDAAQNTTAATEKTEPKADKTPTDQTPALPSETTAIETSSNSTMTSISKPRETTKSDASEKSDASRDAAKATADETTGDSVVTLTGTADTATASASETAAADDSNAADFIAAPGTLVAVGFAVALWQLL